MNKQTPFRKSQLRPHAFQRLYFDADHVKPLNGNDKIFAKSTTENWIDSAVGFKSLRHPRPANQSDPLCMMLIVDTLMRLDIHSNIRAIDLVPWMDRWYHDYRWDVRQIGRMIQTLYECQDKAGAPRWGKWRALNNFKPRGTWEYALYPDRETYAWLGKMRQRLEDHCREVIRLERRTKERVKYGNDFPVHVLWDVQDPEDYSNIPISEGIVFRQI